MKQKKSLRARNWTNRIQEITSLLVAEYGTPNLGNFRDPVKEILYIVLSARTTEQLYKAAYKQLRKRFPTLVEISNASISELRECIDIAGLGSKRSAQLREIAIRLIEDFGKRPGYALKKLPEDEVYTYLKNLPGVGPKSALCVMMYSMDFDVFPVDVHAHRIMSRIGVIPRGTKYYKAQSVLPGYVPDRSKELHVALVLHGRRLCKPRIADCAHCPVVELCDTGIRFRRRRSML